MLVDIVLKFDPEKLEAQVETVSVKDDRLRRVWGDNLQRILLKAKSSKNIDGYSVTFSKKAG